MKRNFNSQAKKLVEAMNIKQLLSETKAVSLEGVSLRQDLLKEYANGVNTVNEANHVYMCLEAYINKNPTDKKFGHVMDVIKEGFETNMTRTRLLSIAERLSTQDNVVAETIVNDIDNILINEDSRLTHVVSDGVSTYREQDQELNDLVKECREITLNHNKESLYDVSVPMGLVMEKDGKSFVRFGSTILAITENKDVVEVAKAPIEFIKLSNSMELCCEWKKDEKRYCVVVGDTKYSVNEKGIFEGRLKYDVDKFAEKARLMDNSCHDAANVVLYLAENFDQIYEFHECVLSTNEYGDKVVSGKIENQPLVIVMEGRYQPSCKFVETVEAATEMASKIVGINLHEAMVEVIDNEKRTKSEQQAFIKLQEKKMSSLLERKRDVIDRMNVLVEGSKAYKVLESVLSKTDTLIAKVQDIMDGKVDDGSFVPLHERKVSLYEKETDSETDKEVKDTKDKKTPDDTKGGEGDDDEKEVPKKEVYVDKESEKDDDDEDDEDEDEDDDDEESKEKGKSKPKVKSKPKGKSEKEDTAKNKEEVMESNRKERVRVFMEQYHTKGGKKSLHENIIENLDPETRNRFYEGSGRVGKHKLQNLLESKLKTRQSVGFGSAKDAFGGR